MGKEGFKVERQVIAKNLSAMQEMMQQKSWDWFYISSFDPYLNEYVPMSDCRRYYFSGFSGSVAEALLPAKGKLRLYVDGRYHEQADLECDLNLIEVVKVPHGMSILAALKSDLQKMGSKNDVLGLEKERTTSSFYEYLQSHFKLGFIAEEQIAKRIDLAPKKPLPAIKQLPQELTGQTVEQKLQRVFDSERSAIFVAALDSIAWITNCRGYHLPFMSAFLGRALVSAKKVYVFIPQGIVVECEDPSVEFIALGAEEFEAELQQIAREHDFARVEFEQAKTNAADFASLQNVFKDKLIQVSGGLIPWQSLKTSEELDCFRSAFKRSNRAIFETLNWVKNQYQAGEKVSEKDLYLQTSREYEKMGAIGQSFNTIAGVGANGSIIHYGDPKEEVMIQAGQMILLDSGGYFESGFATDTTRTFIAGGEVDLELKKIYTLNLKGTLSLQNAVFKEGTFGSALDALARQPLYQQGYDYAHGTGHGVGISVHEDGVRISPTSTLPMRAGQVVSIEPGIYLAGKAGVRLENIAIVKKHPEFEGFLCFENLVMIGFEPELIDEGLLTEQEFTWLENYERECEKLGMSFKYPS